MPAFGLPSLNRSLLCNPAASFASMTGTEGLVGIPDAVVKFSVEGTKGCTAAFEGRAFSHFRLWFWFHLWVGSPFGWLE